MRWIVDLGLRVRVPEMRWTSKEAGRAAAVICAAALAALLVGVPAAFAGSPWWHVVSVSRPTNLHAGLAANEVQQINVQATGGNVVVIEPVSFEELVAGTIEFPQLKLTQFAWDATPAAAQAALEAIYGPGNVEVTGGPSAIGTGDLTEESTEVTALSLSSGTLAVGQQISGEGIPPGTTISALEGEKVTLSAPVEGGKSATGVELAVLAPYTVTFKGALAAQTLKVMNTEFGFLGGLKGTATATQTSEGKPDGTIVVLAENVGNADVNGTTNPVTVTDVVPHGLKAVGISAEVPKGAALNSFIPLKCTASSLTCTFGEKLPPYNQIEVRIPVVVEAGAKTGEENVASISGGEAASASSAHPVVISEAPAPFGIEDYELTNEEPGGTLDAQAGSHPFQQTSTIVLNTSSATSGSAESSALPKDLNFKWPAGLIGDPTRFPDCTLAQFFTNACPRTSVLGVATSLIDEAGNIGVANVVVPLFNLEPALGQPARLGFLPAGTPVSIGATLRTGEDYGITVNVENITQVIAFLSSEVTVWGVPGVAGHDAQRDNGCLLEARGVPLEQIIEDRLAPCTPLAESDPPPFLTLPTACTGPLETSVQGDSWREPLPSGEQPTLARDVMPALDGCNRLPFTPSIKVTPDGAAASTATGLTVDEHVPQQSTLAANGLAESAVKGLSVTLPAGVAINPSAGDGLLSCSQAQIGLQSAGASSCPEAAKVATVKVKVPVLANPLEGAAYIADQNANPFGSLMAMYIYAEDPISGVRIKAAGEVLEDPVTGQLTAHFERDPAFEGKPDTFQFLPDAPFEDVELHFFGGERAPLATPAHCGAYTTTGTFVPWSAQSSDEAAVTAASSSTFEITSGPHGTPCPGASLPFSPTLTGGTTNINAGAFSPLTTTIGREDGEQNLGSVQLHMPAGVEGLLSSVKLCPETQANEGTCGPESQIGETIVSAGVGSDPVAVKGGRVYITEKYQGAPYGLSIVNPVKAGPFDLEHDTSNPANNPPCDCLVVRAKIEVNPRTGELTVTTDPNGAHAIPHIIDGIPVQIKKVNVLVNREHFTFNPTNCNPLAMTGTIASDESASKPLSVPFQIANCAVLKFAPQLTVAAGAHGSKANGESLLFKIAYPKGAMGTQSWINEAKFDIPRQLPARLNTLQQACLAATFETDRPACPAASIIGHAIVHTQVLPVPLEGPVYFVSYGGAKFPEAVLVLKGYGLTIELHGETFIGKEGVTSATFRNTPDVPFESLEVSIPTGPFSEFGVNLPAKDKYNFCGQKLVMPTFFKASNGLEIHQNTPVNITGCAKTTSTRAHKLAKALKACKRNRSHARRAKCERAARKRYG